MPQGIRRPNNWVEFVNHIYEEGHNNDSKYSFKQALKDASARKDAMVNDHQGGKKIKQKKSKRSGSKRKNRNGKKTMKRRK
jgi:hypothetical protein